MDDIENVITDIEMVLKGLECCSNPQGDDCDNCPYNEVGYCAECTSSLAKDALELLKEQEAEIAFLKAMQLQTVHNMSNEDIGNAVRNVLRL